MSISVDSGVIVKRQDMKTTQEKAANMIVQQAADVKAKEVLVVVGDIDISVRLLQFCCQCCHYNFDLSCRFHQFVVEQ